MREKIMRLLIKLFVRETIIFEDENYPNYENLKDFGYLNVSTFSGDFTFKVKEDVVNDFGIARRWFLPNRFFTVELMSIFEHPREKPYYSDKIMLVVKLGGLCFSKKTLINMFVDLYLDEIWKEHRINLERNYSERKTK